MNMIIDFDEDDLKPKQQAKIISLPNNKNEDKKKTDITESIEFRFIKYFKSKPNSYKVDIDTTELYIFKNTYYEIVKDLDIKKEINGFLTNFAKKELNSKNINSTLNTLKSSGFEAFDKQEKNTIPFLDYHLKIDNNGDFHKIEADEKTNFRYVVNAKLEQFTDQFTENTIYISDILPDGLFKRFIETSLANKDDRELVQEYLGYTLLNNTDFQVCQYWQGGGSNGKGILMKLIEKIHEKTITINFNSNNNFSLSNLPNSSLVLVPETDKIINESLFKSLVAGDRIEINRKNKDAFSIIPTAKYIFSGNHFPIIKDFSDGVWRRLQIIHFNKQFKGDEIIFGLDRLIIETEFHIFVEWVLAGLQRLLKRGKFKLTENQISIIENQKTESNSVYAFIEEYNIKKSQPSTSIVNTALHKENVYKKYVEYCDNNGFYKSNSINFWKMMKTKIDYQEQKRNINGKRIRVVYLTMN
jgi:P4 family phage/plasmid primase-like protien